MASSRKSKSNKLPERLAGTLAPLVPAQSSILLGLSGGMDSVVLLHLLTQLAPRNSWKLSALHVHHGISPNAEAWTQFCMDLCRQLGVQLQVQRVDISPHRHLGVEAAARKLRHDALMCQPVDFVALAHHQDDQAETLLLQLLRGAGVKGAAAMPVLKQDRGQPALLRPLLAASRAELLAYAQEKKLHWVDDESNADDSYPRNFLRHRILPLMEQKFPGARMTLARSAQHFAEADTLLDILAEQDAGREYDGRTLAVSTVDVLNPARARNLLRWFLQQRGALMPEHGRLDEMLRQMCCARDDAQPGIAWGAWVLHRYRDRIYVEQVRPEPSPDLCITWQGETELALPHGRLRFVQAEGNGIAQGKLRSALVTVRLRRGEECLRPQAARPQRTLQYLFQQAGVPPWQRAHWPLLYVGEQLAAVPSIALDISWQAAPGETGFRLDWLADAASDTGAKA